MTVLITHSHIKQIGIIKKGRLRNFFSQILETIEKKT